MSDEDKSHDTPVVLDFHRSRAAPADLDIHVHTAHAWTVGGELREMLEEEGVEVRFAGFADSVTHTIVTVVSAAGGAAGAAAVLKVFLQRHRHRKVTVKIEGKEISIEGFSPEDTERLLKDALE
ncbi:MAG: hypothetical protein M3P34_04420 [Actinomycetota bacterium]|nr:hypothetical protein [Actinomycetota bacterium]